MKLKSFGALEDRLSGLRHRGQELVAKVHTDPTTNHISQSLMAIIDAAVNRYNDLHSR